MNSTAKLYAATTSGALTSTAVGEHRHRWRECRTLITSLILCLSVNITLAQSIVPPQTIRGFHELPVGITVVKEFRRDAPEVFAALGIKLTAGSDKPTGHDYRSWGPCTVANNQLHGTAAAPFSGTAFMVQHPDGLRLVFSKPQRIVAMTIAGPTTRTEAEMELSFYDSENKLLATVPATTEHDPQLPFDSRGAIFRGLDTGEPRIASVHARPLKVAPHSAICIALIDYVCFTDQPRDVDREQQVRAWIAGLGADDHKTREESSRQLKELSPAWLPVLRAAQTDDPEVSVRLREVLETLTAKQSNLTPNGHHD